MSLLSRYIAWVDEDLTGSNPLVHDQIDLDAARMPDPWGWASIVPILPCMAYLPFLAILDIPPATNRAIVGVLAVPAIAGYVIYSWRGFVAIARYMEFKKRRPESNDGRP